MDLPPVLGRYDRTRVVILVTGRTAVSRVGGAAAVARHVAAARRMGLDPIVLYPSRMKALGAEIAGEIGDRVICLPASDYHAAPDAGAELVLVIAGDWYIAPAAIIAFIQRTRGPAVARFRDRGRIVAPLARIEVSALRRLIPKLAGNPSSELINQAAAPQAVEFPRAIAGRHRLSDNGAVERCEQKIFASSDDLPDPWPYRLIQRWLTIPAARFRTRTPATPMQVSLAKIAAGLLAAAAIGREPYASALLGAMLFFLSRVLDMVAGDLARSSLRHGSRGEKIDVCGDISVQIAIVWAVAFHLGAATAALSLAAVASAGILASAFVAYRRVFRGLWEAESRGERPSVSPDNFGSRFWRRNGATAALVLAALLAQWNAFLWAAAAGSHLVWILWLRESRHGAVPT